jgi:hypothetical protein
MRNRGMQQDSGTVKCAGHCPSDAAEDHDLPDFPHELAVYVHLDQHDPRRLCATLNPPSKAAAPQPPNDLPDCDPAPISLGEVLELEDRVLATTVAPNFEPPPPQVADRRARDRRGTVGQLRHESPARLRHGPPDYVQACGAQLIDQVLGAHAGEVEVSRPWQASAVHNCLSEHRGDLLV